MKFVLLSRHIQRDKILSSPLVALVAERQCYVTVFFVQTFQLMSDICIQVTLDIVLCWNNIQQ